MLNRLLIIHGGGPTCVLNASTYGVIMEAKKHPEKIGGVFGCMGGVGGLLKRDFRRLDCLGQEKLEQLKTTPGTVIGSTRYPLAESDYARLADVLREEGFSYVLMSGGNGTMDTCGRLHRACVPKGILAGGVPKTIDNDISVTDHSPGFGSAARIFQIPARAGRACRTLQWRDCFNVCNRFCSPR